MARGWPEQSTRVQMKIHCESPFHLITQRLAFHIQRAQKLQADCYCFALFKFTNHIERRVHIHCNVCFS